MVLVVASTLKNLAACCRKWTEWEIQLYLPLKDSIFHLWSTCSSTGLWTLVHKADKRVYVVIKTLSHTACVYFEKYKHKTAPSGSGKLSSVYKPLWCLGKNAVA